MITTPIEHVSVSSSNIRSIGYDAWTGSLEVRFHSGGIYQHYDVPATLHREFLDAGSKGGFYHRNLKNGYGCCRVG